MHPGGWADKEEEIGEELGKGGVQLKHKVENPKQLVKLITNKPLYPK